MNTPELHSLIPAEFTIRAKKPCLVIEANMTFLFLKEKSFTLGDVTLSNILDSDGEIKFGGIEKVNIATKLF